MYRICDYCDTKMTNTKLEKNMTDTISSQQTMIELLQIKIEEYDNMLAQKKEELEQRKEQFRQFEEKADAKKQKQSAKLQKVREELQKLIEMKNQLDMSLAKDEKIVKEKEDERDKLLMLKEVKNTELEKKDRELVQMQTEN